MGNIKFVDKLPKKIREEFNEVVISKNYRDCGSLVLWLKERGYPTSKSAVHRYVSENRGKLSASVSVGSGLAEIRLRAFELSAKLEMSTDLYSIKERADDILDWVFKS
ncbi:phage protein Gp27 family protein [Klebsiella oxytoca]